MSISDSLYEPDSNLPGEEHMPAQVVDCALHGRCPSIDPNTGRPPVYRKERFVSRVVEFEMCVDDGNGGKKGVPTTHETMERVPYGPWLPAGGGVCRLCWEARGNAVSAPAPPEKPSILGAIANSLGITPDEARAMLRAELEDKPTP